MGKGEVGMEGEERQGRWRWIDKEERDRVYQWAG